MWRCNKCGKPVFFAERRQSLGFDWHPWCLKCEECGKRLNPGQHAEHKGTPYCHIPCYSALFGPKLFGHGSRVESHQSFGQRSVSFIREQKSLQRKIEEYNDYLEETNEGARLGITFREVNGRLVLEGVLRVYWGIDHSIRLREFNDQRLISKANMLTRDRKCLSVAAAEDIALKSMQAESDDDDDESGDEEIESLEKESSTTPVEPSVSESRQLADDDLEGVVLRKHFKQKTLPQYSLVSRVQAHLADHHEVNHTFPSKDSPNVDRKSNLDRSIPLTDISKSEELEKDPIERMFEDLKQKSATSTQKPRPLSEGSKVVRGQGPRALRRRHGKKMDRSKIRRRSSINGHWYDRDTSVFTPPKGSSMSVHITSLLTTPDVVRMLLEKYQVENEMSQFALYVVKDNGERRLVKDHEFPLLLRVNLGPREDIAKLFLMDKTSTDEIKHEVAQYLKFTYAECRAFLNMFYEEEETEVAKIKYKYKLMKQMIRERMFDLRVQL